MLWSLPGRPAHVLVAAGEWREGVTRDHSIPRILCSHVLTV